ncbi:MAG: pitrilysin family protein [Elusimicrobiota bacterium]
MKRLLWLLLALAPPGAGHAEGIAFSTFTLDNGLRVILSRDASVPVTAVSMIFNVGGRNEVRGRSGFAHLFEHLMFEGSKNVPKGGFDRILESYGGDNNASTHEDFTLYYEVVPSNALPIALWLDADRVGALSVTKDAVDTQIQVVKEEKRMRVDNEPYGPLLDDVISSHVFVNWQNAHPVIGSFEDLDAAGLGDVKKFFADYYAPSNAILAIVGDFEPEEARRWVADLFGAIPNRGTVPQVDTTEPENHGAGALIVVPDKHAKLPALAAVWKNLPARGSDDFFALTLLGSALTQGKSSRLYQSLVKTSQAAVSVEGGGLGFPVSDAAEYKAPGSFGLFVIHKSSRATSELQGLLSAELAKVAAGGLEEAELARVKTKFRSDWLMAEQTRLGRAERLLIAALLDASPAAADRLSRYLAVTSSDIRRVAARYLKPGEAFYFQAVPAGEAP